MFVLYLVGRLVGEGGLSRLPRTGPTERQPRYGLHPTR